LRRLQRAHTLLALGEARRAAAILWKLAESGRRRRRPEAGLLFIEAGRAHLQAGEDNLAMQALRQGLGLLAARGQMRRLEAVGGRVLERLRDLGMISEAAALRSEFLGRYPQLDFTRRRTIVLGPLAELPPVCPHCGAPIRPDELVHNGSGTVICAYCGLSIRAGSG
jgi:hypothetical protein